MRPNEREYGEMDGPPLSMPGLIMLVVVYVVALAILMATAEPPLPS